MINKILKDFRNAIHKNLKVEPQNKKSSCFVICENEEKSAIKQIHFIFKNQDDVLILKQDRTRELKQNYTIENLFEIQKDIPNTNSCCDFIVFLNSKNGLEIYYCEIKSSYTEEHLNKAIHQLESSSLFISYLLGYYQYIYKVYELKPSKIQRFYIYPKINISSKSPSYKKDNKIHLKSIEIDEQGCAKISNGYEFFTKLAQNK